MVALEFPLWLELPLYNKADKFLTSTCNNQVCGCLIQLQLLQQLVTAINCTCYKFQLQLIALKAVTMTSKSHMVLTLATCLLVPLLVYSDISGLEAGFS